MKGQNVTHSFIPLSGSPSSLICTPNQNLVVQLKHMWEIEKSLCYFIIKEYNLYGIHLLEIIKIIFMHWKKILTSNMVMVFLERPNIKDMMR